MCARNASVLFCLSLFVVVVFFNGMIILMIATIIGEGSELCPINGEQTINVTSDYASKTSKVFDSSAGYAYSVYIF